MNRRQPSPTIDSGSVDLGRQTFHAVSHSPKEHKSHTGRQPSDSLATRKHAAAM